MPDRYIVATDTPPMSDVQPARLYRLDGDHAVLAGQGATDQMRTLAHELNGDTHG